MLSKCPGIQTSSMHWCRAAAGIEQTPIIIRMRQANPARFRARHPSLKLLWCFSVTRGNLETKLPTAPHTPLFFPRLTNQKKRLFHCGIEDLPITQ